jgi:hypothetical protein
MTLRKTRSSSVSASHRTTFALGRGLTHSETTLVSIQKKLDVASGKFFREDYIDAPFVQPVQCEIIDDRVLNQTLRLEIFFESISQNRGFFLLFR